MVAACRFEWRYTPIFRFVCVADGDSQVVEDLSQELRWDEVLLVPSLTDSVDFIVSRCVRQRYVLKLFPVCLHSMGRSKLLAKALSRPVADNCSKSWMTLETDISCIEKRLRCIGLEIADALCGIALGRNGRISLSRSVRQWDLLQMLLACVPIATLLHTLGSQLKCGWNGSDKHFCPTGAAV